MNFEQWKMQRQLDEQSEFNSYNAKVKSTATFCFVFFGVSILVLMAIAITYVTLV